MSSTATRSAVRDAINGLRAVRGGHVYEPHAVRHKLAVARDLEKQLDKWRIALWTARESAEKAFLEGWPKATGAPWMID